MPITALALLKLDSGSLPSASRGLRVQELDDAILLHTGVDFSADPQELVQSLVQILGDALDEHDDARGIFLVPHVAAPKARTYLDVIEEVGEGGSWLPVERGSPFGLPGGLGALSAVLGSMLQNMPESVLEAASAAARGDMAAFNQVSDQVAALMGHGHDDVSLASLARLVGDGRGLDLSSPAFQQIISTLEGEMAKNPEKLERLREQFFGNRGEENEGEGS